MLAVQKGARQMLQRERVLVQVHPAARLRELERECAAPCQSDYGTRH